MFYLTQIMKNKPCDLKILNLISSISTLHKNILVKRNKLNFLIKINKS